MIIKVKKADNSGWVLRDGITKIRYNTTEYKVKTVSHVLNQYEVLDQYNQVTCIDGVDICEINTFEDNELFPCVMVFASVEHDRDIIILTNTSTYVLNDNGKTIESL